MHTIVFGGVLMPRGAIKLMLYVVAVIGMSLVLFSLASGGVINFNNVNISDYQDQNTGNSNFGLTLPGFGTNNQNNNQNNSQNQPNNLGVAQNPGPNSRQNSTPNSGQSDGFAGFFSSIGQKNRNKSSEPSKDLGQTFLIVDRVNPTRSTSCAESNPCGLYEALNYAIEPGTTVLLRSGTYVLNQPIGFRASGNNKGFLTLAAYPGETVIISGAGINPNQANGGLIQIEDQSYIRIMDIEIANYQSNAPFATISAISVQGASENIHILNNHIHDINSLAIRNNTSALGILVYGTRERQASRDIYIMNNRVHDLQTGFSEAITLAGNIDGFQIEGNEVYNLHNIAIVVAGSYKQVCLGYGDLNAPQCDTSQDYTRNGNIIGNIAYNIDTRNNPAYTNAQVNAAAALYVDGARNVVVEDNIIFNAGVGMSISSENAGGLAQNVRFANNFLYNNWRTGLSIGPENATKGYVDGCEVVNNTFFSNDESTQFGGEIFMEYHVQNCNIKNNIFYADNYAFDAATNQNLQVNLIINESLPPAQSDSFNNNFSGNYFYSNQGGFSGFWQGNYFNDTNVRSQGLNIFDRIRPNFRSLKQGYDENSALLDLRLDKGTKLLKLGAFPN